MKTSILLLALSMALVSCGKNGIQIGEVKKKVKKKSRVAVARNNDVIIVGEPGDLSPEDQAALEGRVNGQEGSDLPLPEGQVGSTEGTGVEISTEAGGTTGYTTGTNTDGFAASANARVVIDVIDNEKNERLWTIPINGMIEGVHHNGRFRYNRLHFDVNVQRILTPYFGVSGEFLGSWNQSSHLNRRLYGGAGLNLDILGNLRRPGITPHLLTSFYIMGGQDHLADGTDHARARGSFRIELRDIYLLNADDPNKVSLRLFGKLDTSVSMTNLSDNWLSTEAGVSILTPQFLDGMRVGITPSYSYTRMDFDNNSPVEHQHMFNLAFSLEGPRIKVNR